jgi:hypothetical protein
MLSSSVKILSESCTSKKRELDIRTGPPITRHAPQRPRSWDGTCTTARTRPPAYTSQAHRARTIGRISRFRAHPFRAHARARTAQFERALTSADLRAALVVARSNHGDHGQDAR